MSCFEQLARFEGVIVRDYISREIQIYYRHENDAHTYKTLPFRPKKEDTDKAMFDEHCSSFQRLAVSCQDGSHNEHLAPHGGGAHRGGGLT